MSGHIRRRRSAIRSAARMLAVAVVLLGAAVCLGWLLGIPRLESPFPGQVSTKFNTALGLMLAGTAIVAVEPDASRSARVVGRLAAAALLLLGIATLSQDVFGWELGLDQLVVSEPRDPVGTARPGRMSPHTSGAFALLGTALLAGDRPGTGAALSDACGTATALIAFGSLVGYAYRAEVLYGLPGTTRIAVPTAGGLICLGLAVLALRPDRGLAGFLTAEGAGPHVARLLLPWVFLVPVLLGLVAVRVIGSEPTGLSEALLAVGAGVAGALGVSWAAWRATRLDRQRVEALRQRDELMSVVTHELRNVFTPLAGATEMLAHAERAEDLVRIARYRRIVQQSTEHGVRLLQDLSDLDAVDRGALTIRPRRERLAAVVREVATMAELSEETGAGGLSLRLELPESGEEVEVDRDRLVQALWNVVRNAMQHVPGSSTVTLAVRRSGEEVVVSVIDEGPGIASEDLPRIFDRFWSGRGPERRSGRGLGLAIARELVEAMGGRIEVESRPGEGTRFDLVLPAAPGGRPPTNFPGTSPGSGKGPDPEGP